MTGTIRWTDEDLKVLIRHLNKGASLYLLRAALPKFSRNAIAGKMKRLGLSCNGTSMQIGKLAIKNITVSQQIAMDQMAKKKNVSREDFIAELVQIGWKTYEEN